jgi:hypothetical protein
VGGGKGVAVVWELERFTLAVEKGRSSPGLAEYLSLVSGVPRLLDQEQPCNRSLISEKSRQAPRVPSEMSLTQRVYGLRLRRIKI